MKRFLILTKAMFLMHLRNGSVLFWNFAFPILLMLIYGTVMRPYMDYMTPGEVHQMLAKAEVAKAEGEAQATLVRAKAQAEANQLLQATLTPNLIQSKAIDKWNGTLPQVVVDSENTAVAVWGSTHAGT